MSKYDDIIDYNYVMKRKIMSIEDRSYEFAPFSALVGFNDLIKERERETISEIDISEERKEDLDLKLKIINSKINLHPEVFITYFVPDKKKTGGSYQKIANYIKKIDFYHKLIVLENSERIKIENIINIDSIDIDLNDFLS